MSDPVTAPAADPRSPAVAPERLLRAAEVERQTGVSRSQLYRLMSAGKFPKPVTLYGKAKAWPESQVQAWIAARIAASVCH
jgi:prophage regulatory protein